MDACCLILFILGKHDPIINIITVGAGEREGEEVPAASADATHAALTDCFPPFCMYSFNSNIGLLMYFSAFQGFGLRILLLCTI